MSARYTAAILEAFDRFEERPSIVREGTELTFGTVRNSVRQVARALESLGVQRGAGVFCMTGNQPEALLVRLAAYVLGARFTTMVYAPESSLPHILHDSEPTVAVSDSVLPAADIPHRLSLDELMELAARRPIDPVPVRAQEEDVAILCYTSGTTGMPKAVAVNYTALYHHMASQWEWKEQFGDGLTFVCATPLAGAAGHDCLNNLCFGRRVEVLEQFSPERLRDVCASADGVETFVYPSQVYQLMHHPATGQGIPGLTSVTYGASRISPTRLREALTLFEGSAFRQVYGMTETLGLTTLSPEDHTAALDGKPHWLTSAGRPCRGVEVEIRDEMGEPLPCGGTGEVCLRTRTMMTGYWNRPDLTAQTLRSGWLHTGDVGRVDTDGYLYLFDRFKDVIAVGGQNCYSGPIEAILSRHPAIDQAAVVGTESETTGEEIHGFLIAAADWTGSRHVAAKDACEDVRQELTPADAPVAVHWIEQMPLTSSGKPDKKQLRKRVDDCMCARRDAE